MYTFERGSIVEFGPPSARRVGAVVGAFDDYQRGETLCVLTPEASAKGQAFDACPVTLMNVQPASLDDLRAHAAEVKRAIVERIDGLTESLRLNEWTPELTSAQRETLGRLFDLTAATDEADDTPLAPEGSHRALHTFLTRELGERIPETRGAVYTLAAAYLRRHETPA